MSRRAALGLAAVVAIGVLAAVALVLGGSGDDDTDRRAGAPASTTAPSAAPDPDPGPGVDGVDGGDGGDEVFTVAPDGDDDAPGTAEDPFGTIQHAIRQLEPGDVLEVRGGTYREQVELPYAEMTPGTPDAPITVRAAPGERPVIEGRFRLSGADHWTISGINVTWSPENEDDEHLVQFRGGRGWRFTNAEVWGAESFSAINVGHGAHDFTLDHLYVHDTVPTNDVNQDHLIYLASGNQGGLVEHNVLAFSPNGRGIKLGPGSPEEPGTDEVVIRYNTFYANEGPSNIRLSGDSRDNEIYGNIFVRPADGEAAVSAFELTGERNVVRDNIWWDAEAAVADVDGLVDGGGNRELDPELADPDGGDFRPQNPAARSFGAYARPGAER